MKWTINFTKSNGMRRDAKDTYDSAAFDTFIVLRSSFCLRNVISLLICSTGLLLSAAPAEPEPWLDAPRRYAFLISISVVFTQPGIGRCTSQNARSCESSTFRSNLSRFLSTLLCASAYYETRIAISCVLDQFCEGKCHLFTCINMNSHFLENIFCKRAKFSAS